MLSITDSSVTIETSAHSVPSTPSWLGEVTLIAHSLKRLGVLSALAERVRFARRRLGQYDVIDFVVVLLGYAISGEPTLEAFYDRLQPFASAFMALFERNQLPSRSALSRFLAALDQAPVEALRTLFLEDLAARSLEKEEKLERRSRNGKDEVDRESQTWLAQEKRTRKAGRRCSPHLGSHQSNFQSKKSKS
jgi:hypothetical protein